MRNSQSLLYMCKLIKQIVIILMVYISSHFTSYLQEVSSQVKSILHNEIFDVILIYIRFFFYEF